MATYSNSNVLNYIDQPVGKAEFGSPKMVYIPCQSADCLRLGRAEVSTIHKGNIPVGRGITLSSVLGCF